MKTLALSILCLASVALAEDFKAIDGKEYKNVTVKRVESDGIVLMSSSGISKVYFTELPKEVQERFHYDAPKAIFSAEQNPNLEAQRKPDATPDAAEPMAISGIETLPPITVKLNNELLNALKMTDNSTRCINVVAAAQNLLQRPCLLKT